MTEREKIRQTLVELLEADLGEKFTDLTEEKNLRDELGLDSVDLVSVVSQIERRLRIRLTQQELEKMATVGDVLDILQAKMRIAAAA